MTNINEHNVYFGPDALKKYFDPDCQPPLPLVELPDRLNPFHQDGVRIYAKMMTMHPANNVKAIPGMSALSRTDLVPGPGTDETSDEPARKNRGAWQDPNDCGIQLRVHSHLDVYARSIDAWY